MCTKIKEFAKKVFEILQPECKAIYLGGSLVDNYIKNSHDIDLILFIDITGETLKEIRVQKAAIYRKLRNFCRGNPDLPIVLSINYKNRLQPGVFDLIQCRATTLDTHIMLNNVLTFWSYLDHFKIKLAGEDVELFDILSCFDKYLVVLKNTATMLKNNSLNQKRWYQVYIGLSILENNSYELTDEQKLNANILHDMKDETLDIRLKLQQEIIQKLEKM